MEGAGAWFLLFITIVFGGIAAILLVNLFDTAVSSGSTATTGMT